MLNLEKGSFIDNIVLKHSFQMALMNAKNLVYNKLARQNIFFALLIQFRFLLLWLNVIIVYILILIIIITIDFIILLLLLYIYCYYVIIIIVINVIYFLSHYFLLFILLWLLFVCCEWRVCVLFFPLFLLMIYILYSQCLYMSRIIFL